MAGLLGNEPKKAQPAVEATRCAKCGKAFETGESLKSTEERFFHLACFYMRTNKASKRRIRRQAEAKRADQVALSDAAAEESMRGYKPSDWRLGKSPSDYGR
ncbi:hypothetical protein ABZ613_28970 [Streptomyces collinus]|uniref:hypothetical protein n=1 Tax=Streptomyces collinus TaxID=42684 RepID=UPI0033FE4C23